MYKYKFRRSILFNLLIFVIKGIGTITIGAQNCYRPLKPPNFQ